MGFMNFSITLCKNAQQSIRIFWVKITLKTGQEKFLLSILCWKLISLDVIENFYEKWLLLSKLLMSFYTEPDSHIRDKVKVALNYKWVIV